MSSWLDYTINGLILGNIYALVAVGLALIFGVSRLINFAQGSIYLVGAYVGWVAVVAAADTAFHHHYSGCGHCGTGWLDHRTFRFAATAEFGAHCAAAGDDRHQLRARSDRHAHLFAQSARAAEPAAGYPFSDRHGNDRSARHPDCLYRHHQRPAAVCFPALYQARLGRAGHGAGSRRRACRWASMSIG